MSEGSMLTAVTTLVQQQWYDKDRGECLQNGPM